MRLALSGNPSSRLANACPVPEKLVGKAPSASAQRNTGRCSGQVQTAGLRKWSADAGCPSPFSFRASFDPAQLLIEVVRDIELAAIVHLAVLNTPRCEAIGSGELNTGRRIGVAGNAREAEFGSKAVLIRVGPDLPVARIAIGGVEQHGGADHQIMIESPVVRTLEVLKRLVLTGPANAVTGIAELLFLG